MLKTDKIISDSGSIITSKKELVAKLVETLHAVIRLDIAHEDGSIIRRWIFDFSSVEKARINICYADERGKVQLNFLVN